MVRAGERWEKENFGDFGGRRKRGRVDKKIARKKREEGNELETETRDVTETSTCERKWRGMEDKRDRENGEGWRSVGEWNKRRTRRHCGGGRCKASEKKIGESAVERERVEVVKGLL